VIATPDLTRLTHSHPQPASSTGPLAPPTCDSARPTPTEASAASPIGGRTPDRVSCRRVRGGHGPRLHHKGRCRIDGLARLGHLLADGQSARRAEGDALLVRRLALMRRQRRVSRSARPLVGGGPNVAEALEAAHTAQLAKRKCSISRVRWCDRLGVAAPASHLWPHMKRTWRGALMHTMHSRPSLPSAVVAASTLPAAAIVAAAAEAALVAFAAAPVSSSSPTTFSPRASLSTSPTIVSSDRSTSASPMRSSAYSSVSPAHAAASRVATSVGHSPAVASGTPGGCHLAGCSGLRSSMRQRALSPTALCPVSAASIVMPIA
jgi:hypothetical protein